MLSKKSIVIIIILTVVMAIAGWFGCRSQSSPERVSLRLPIPVVDTAFAPYYLAVDHGFYQDEGIEVDLNPGTPEFNPAFTVSLAKDQFGVLGGPELLLTARHQGAHIKGIALLHKNSDFVVLVTLRESLITQLSDLRGKKVGFFYGHISTDILRMLFKKEGVTVVEDNVGFDYSQLIAGKIPAMWAFRTTAGLTLPAQGVEIREISPADYGITTHGHVIITNSEFAKNNPELTQRFVNATLRGLALAIDQPELAIQATVARDRNFLPKVGRQQLEIYTQAVLNNTALGMISDADLIHTRDQMAAVGLVPPDFDVSDAFDSHFVLKALEDSEGNP